MRTHIREELGQLGDNSILITERGRPLAVVVSVERWNDLQAEIEDLEDATAILEHRLELKRAEPAEEVFASLDQEESDAPCPARQSG